MARTFLCTTTRRGCALAMSSLLALSCASAGPAFAQQAPDGGLIGGFRDFLGSGDQPSGAYASPDAIPEASGPGVVGLTGPRTLERFNPIALPDMSGLGNAPRLNLPSLPGYAPTPSLPTLDSIRLRKALVLEAKLSDDGEPVPAGLVWRLFAPIEAPDGKLPLVATAAGGAATFDVAPGSYLLHVGFGRAGITKRIDFDGEQTREVVVLNAGGLKLHAIAVGDVPIPAEALSFDIYSDAPNERDRILIAEDIPPGRTVQLNAGTYHVASTFGSVNAVVRADIKVEPGKITDVTLQHHAAQLTMKLVRETGGEAIADTAWSVTNGSGDVIRESVGAFPSMVLEEGEYLIVAKNKDRMYQRDFTVQAGVNTDVEVLTSDIIAAPETGQGSGD
ncbi:hypothetical protein [Aureimonas sp. SA4125]|uniref:hypothetical protein n=1 Tax=Aureimonas sp. SA4125 TaxID=2826993 RepID=UPI001CC41975|nr:hypothetical protein [Aureimonas sp. SA4125]